VIWKKYKTQIIGSILGVIIAGGIPSMIWMHNAYADGRYVQQDDAIRQSIQRLDTMLTVMDQEILFAESDQQKAKFMAIKAIYVREREALKAELQD
jgi:hypothetical protein